MASKKFAPQPIPPFSTEKPHKEEKPVKVKRAHHPPQANLNMQRTSSDEDEKACGPRSPLQWIYDFGGQEKKPTATGLTFFPKSSTTNTSTATNPSVKDHSSQEARKKAAHHFLRVDSDDEGNSAFPASSEPNSDTSSISTIQRYPPQNKTTRETTPASQSSSVASSFVPPSYDHSSNNSNPINFINNNAPPEHTSIMRPLTGEARIVAPNVSKLSPHSAVEVRLQSNSESVAVLCSVDVLKMRSGFFHDVLNEQEKNNGGPPPNMHTRNANNTTTNHSPPHNNILWREPIIIPEKTPFEAAAFLESLHEGRALFRGEWNYCWARLSVTWVVEDLIIDYAAQIEDHMNKVVSIIQAQHWRTNPSILAGMRISVFRKGSNPIPTVVTGTIVESPPNIGYSKIRVLFDNDRAAKNMAGTSNNNMQPSPATTVSSQSSVTTHIESMHLKMMDPMELQSPHFAGKPSLIINTPQQHPHLQQQQQHHHHHQQHQQQMHHFPPQHSTIPLMIDSPPQQIVGDVSEPLWVQNTREGSLWCDPDDLFLQESKRFVTTTDKRFFWEMARALIDFPEISMACKTGIRNAQDLTSALKRPEFRILWTFEAAEYLTKDMAVDLIRSAFCPVIHDK